MLSDISISNIQYCYCKETVSSGALPVLLPCLPGAASAPCCSWSKESLSNNDKALAGRSSAFPNAHFITEMLFALLAGAVVAQSAKTTAARNATTRPPTKFKALGATSVLPQPLGRVPNGATSNSGTFSMTGQCSAALLAGAMEVTPVCAPSVVVEMPHLTLFGRKRTWTPSAPLTAWKRLIECGRVSVTHDA